MVEVEKIVEVIVEKEKIVEIPVDRIVEVFKDKIVEVEKEKIVEKVVYKDGGGGAEKDAEIASLKAQLAAAAGKEHVVEKTIMGEDHVIEKTIMGDVTHDDFQVSFVVSALK